jgi:integrase
MLAVARPADQRLGPGGRPAMSRREGRALVKFRMRDGSGEIDFKFLKEDVDRYGNVRIYFRRQGQRKIRLHETPGTPEFLAEYRDAVEGRTQPAPMVRRRAKAAKDTLRWLVEEYYESAAFKTLDQSTRGARRGILDAFTEKHGWKRYAQMEARHVRKCRDEKLETPEAANGLVKALRQVFAFAIADDLVKTNPAKDVGYLESNNPEGFHTWTLEEVAQYVARHPIGTKAHLALSLFLFTGLRRSDVVKLGPQHRSGGKHKLVQFKGRKKKRVELDLPILSPLQAAIDAAPASKALAYLVTEFGKPFTSNGLGNKMRQWCDQAGLAGCSAHGLRKAGATIAADNGATPHQLMAIFGWETLKQAEHYTKHANRRRLAEDGMNFLLPAPSTESEQAGQLPGPSKTVGPKHGA